MTAGEEEPQPVIAQGALLDRLVLGVQQRRLSVLGVAGRLAAQPVDGPVARGGDDPPGRARRQSRGWPPPGRLGERVLDGVLGGVDVSEDAGQDGPPPARLPAGEPPDVRRPRPPPPPPPPP